MGGVPAADEGGGGDREVCGVVSGVLRGLMSHSATPCRIPFDKEIVMPTISMFYGILVSMFFEDNDRHSLPHIHIRYSGSKASIAIEDGRVLAGGIPPKQLKMVQAWIEIHNE